MAARGRVELRLDKGGLGAMGANVRHIRGLRRGYAHRRMTGADGGHVLRARVRNGHLRRDRLRVFVHFKLQEGGTNANLWNRWKT